MYAAIYVPDFPVEVLLRTAPELREQAVAVVQGAPPLVHVIAVNEKAVQAGIEPGMTKLEAEERFAHIKQASALRQRSAEQEAAAHAALLDCAAAFSPRVEDTAANTVVLDISGLQRIFGPPAKIARDLARRCSEIGLEANIAIAANPDTAVLAACGFAGVTIIAEGAEAQRLGELSVEVLVTSDWRNALPVADRLTIDSGRNLQSTTDNRKSGEPPPVALGDEHASTSVEILETLEKWGVRNLRALAALPDRALAERLGQEGLYLQKLARGEVRRPLVVAEPPLHFEEMVELEYPIDTLEPLAFLLNRMLEQLCARLASRALATNELKLRLGLDVSDCGTADLRNYGSDGRLANSSTVPQFANSAIHERVLRLPVPMLDAKVFLKLLQLDLQVHPPQAPVIKVGLRAEPAQPRRTQNGLFVPQAPEVERLSVTLARINKVVGTGNQEKKARVGSPEILDTHRPDGFVMKAFGAESMAGDPANRQSSISSRQGGTGPQDGTREDAHATARIALRAFRPPLQATVSMREERPAHVASAERPTLRGEVVWCAGPWRSSGDWWTEQAWSRAEWDVAVRNEEGITLYRIYRDEIGGKWWVEGTYD